jgi:dCTP deaminase
MSDSKNCTASAVKGCVLSDKDIIDELNKSVIIEPFNRDQVGPNSYDTTLGEFYYERNTSEDDMPAFYNPLNGKHVAKFWNVNLNASMNYGAKKAKTITTQDEEDLYDLKIGDKFIVIKSGHMILAHTNEFIGSRDNVTTMMKSRSTIGRGGLTICSCAGSGDVGFFNRYTYEIHNRNPIPVVLRVGDRIGQILFMRTGEVLTSYEKRGQYQNTSDITELINNWTPLGMIPKCGVDYAKTIPFRKRNTNSSIISDDIVLLFVVFVFIFVLYIIYI